MREKIQQRISQWTQELERNQSRDGAWRYCFESGPMTDAYMILLLQFLQLDRNEEPDIDCVVRLLAARISSLQNVNGAWKLFHDDPLSGNLSATVEAYDALIASGLYSAEAESMKKARMFIRENGGLAKVGTATRAMLACNGQTSWKHYSLPLNWILLPKWFPVNFFDLVGYARAHIAPVLIASTRRMVVKPAGLPDLNFDISGTESTLPKIKPHVTSNAMKVRSAQWFANSWPLRKLERFLLARLEPDGTLLSYASATFFMIYGLLSLGYPRRHPVIVQAVQGLKSLIYPLPEGSHLQNSTSTVWDTALLSYALQVNLKTDTAKMQKGAQAYLLSRQQRSPSDWQLRNPHTEPGGWGFSDVNTLTPDVDDTAAALRAITPAARKSSSVHQAWQRGIQWLISMQNSDGGWPAFERNTDKPALSALKIDGTRAALTDPSAADLTGRTLEFLCNYAGYSPEHPVVQRTIRWLLGHQETNGSWYGRWGICYIYGTWAALTGLLAAGVDSNHPSVRRAVDWLLKIQNEDGGWGESCLSDTRQVYVPLGRSTPSQTAWATDALVAVFSKTIPAIERGVDFLTGEPQSRDWTQSYPTGGGLPGGFYIHFHSYNTVWPLLAFGHYKEKFCSDG